MHILILSANTGGGHNSAAAAMREEFERRGVRCTVEDGLRFVSPQFSSIVSHGHVYVYRHMPAAFGKAYSFQEHHRTTWISNLLRRGVERMTDYIQEQGFTAVVCVHVFTAMMLTEAHRKYRLTIPFYFLSTDYTCSPGVGSLVACRWFTPSENLHNEFIACGIPRDKLMATGIPVKRAFYEPVDRTEARRRLGLPEDGQVLLLCGGSMGCGHMEREMTRLEQELPAHVQAVVICGNNQTLYEKLTELQLKNIKVVGFTEEMPAYMAAADVCITKPGGLTATEILVSACPSVMLLAVPGCESRNLEYFSRTYGLPGAADWETASKKALALLEEPERLQALSLRLQTAKPAVPAAEAIAAAVLKDITAD